MNLLREPTRDEDRRQARVGGILTEKTIGFSSFFLNGSRKFTVAVPKARLCSAVQSFSESRRRRFTCPMVLKNLIGLSAKSRPSAYGLE
jgi:hypothetical protein